MSWHDYFDDLEGIDENRWYEKCPCGNPKGIYVIRDNTPGFRSTDKYLECENCKEKGEKIQ